MKKEESAWREIEIKDVSFKSLSFYVYSPFSFNPPSWWKKRKKELTAKGRAGEEDIFSNYLNFCSPL
jgi:hypothetical protein